MSTKKRVLAVALAGVLLLSSVAAAGTVGSAANGSLVVGVEDAGNDGATVSVTHNDTAVENASVTVAATNDSSYVGAGNYTTDENGTVALPEPEENVTVEVTAEKGNLSGTTTAELTAAELEENGSFGQLVSSFVHEMLNAGGDDGPIGQIISDFVTSNNPGNAPDHAGGPDDPGSQGNSTDENGTDEGDSDDKPDNPGNGNDGNDNENGNGNGNGNASDDETTAADE
jgi:hypothetical protein